MADKPRLYWNLEDVAAQSDDRSVDDVGPAWIDFPATATSPKHSEKVRGGEWITRGEAQQIAREKGYALQEDDGQADPDQAPPAAPRIDAKAINRKLRSLGISADELTVSTSGTGVGLIGSFVQRLERVQNPNAGASGFKMWTAAISTSPDEALAALDELVPGWRSADTDRP